MMDNADNDGNDGGDDDDDDDDDACKTWKMNDEYMRFKWYSIIPPHSQLFSIRPPSPSFHDTWVGLW